MLKNISTADIERLCESQGEERTRVKIKDLPVGIIIRVDTRTGNIYFFEAEIPKQQLMGITRFHPRLEVPNTGFLGVKQVDYLFQIGGIICHGNSATSRVTKLTLLNMEGTKH